MPRAQFSVLLPVYFKDEADTFDLAIKSIMANSLKPSEVIILQDGPVNPELGRSISYWEKDHRVQRFGFRENKGLAAILNLGISQAAYEIVVRADADDINKLDRFEQLIAKIDQGFDLVGGDIKEFDANGRELRLRKCPTTSEGIKRALPFRNPFNHMTVAFRKRIALEVGGYPEIPFHEDYGLWAKMSAKSARLGNTGTVLVHALVNQNFFERRRGLNYIVAGFKLQQLLLSLGITTVPKALCVSLARSIPRLFPDTLLKQIYLRFLRSK